MTANSRSIAESLSTDWRSISGLGLLSALITTTAAVIFVPDNVERAGSLFTPSLIMAVGLLVPPLYLCRSSPILVFYPPCLLAASPIYWLLLDPLQGAYDMPGVSADNVRMAYISIGCFALCVWISVACAPLQLPKAVREATSLNLSGRTLYYIACVAFALAFLRFAIPARFDLGVMFGALSQGRWAAAWGRGSLGGWDAFLDHFSYFGYVVPALAVLIGRAMGYTHWRTLVVFAFSVILIALMTTGGGRRVIGVMIGSAFVTWFLSAKRPKLSHLLAFCGASALLLLFMQLVLMYRGVGILHALSANEKVYSTRVQGPGYLHVDDNFLRLCQVISIIPDRHPYVTTDWLVWVAARPVPRVFWPGKPVDPGFDLPRYLGKSGVSLSMSLIGELYMSLGLVGCCAGGLLLGTIANSLSGVLVDRTRPGGIIIFATESLALFTGMRSGIELVLMSYGALAWIALVWAYQRVRTDRKPAVALRNQ